MAVLKSFKTGRITKRIVISGVLVATIVFVGLPCFTYLHYSLTATTTGSRHKGLSKLESQGPLGRRFVRGISANQLKQLPSYGIFLVLYYRNAWVGVSRKALRNHFGTPDETQVDVDVWWIGKQYAIGRAKEDSSYTWESAIIEWRVVLVAEYENDRVVRLGNPLVQVNYPEEIQTSPYQPHFKIDFALDLDPLNPPDPPAEWPRLKNVTSQSLERADNAAADETH